MQFESTRYLPVLPFASAHNARFWLTRRDRRTPACPRSDSGHFLVYVRWRTELA